jgi:uncharacterized membrane protein YccC
MIVSRILRARIRITIFFRRHWVQLALSIRVTIAALVAFALAQLLHLPLPLWAVLTAVIVTQMSVGRSLMATFDYLVGTLGGAMYGGAVGVFVPHASEVALFAVLALAVAPLAFIAAINPRFSVAPITALIVLLIPTMTHVSPFVSALDRVIEVALGGVTGLVISFLLLPASAHPQVVTAAALTLDQMAEALRELLAGLTRGLDVDALHRIQDGIGEALVHMNVVGAEAERERSTRLAAAPDTAPLLRTLLRLRHDLVIVGRAAAAAREPDFAAPIAPSGNRQGLCRLSTRERGGVADATDSVVTASRRSGARRLRGRNRHGAARGADAPTSRRCGGTLLYARICARTDAQQLQRFGTMRGGTGRIVDEVGSG